MGLNLKISVQEEKNSAIVNDCAGKQSAKNPTGFGYPNPDYKHIESAIIYATPPNHPEGTDPWTIDVTGDFPNEEGYGYEVLPKDVGQVNNEFKSGKWSFKLVISGTDKAGKKFTKTALCVKIFVKQVTCCVDKLIKKVNANASQDKKQQEIILLSNLIESVHYSVECGLYDQAANTIAYVEAQCICSGC